MERPRRFRWYLTPGTGFALALALSLGLASCGDGSVARAAQALRPQAEARRVAAAAAVEASRGLPPAEETYCGWREAREDLETLDAVIEVLAGDEPAAEPSREILAEHAALAERVRVLEAELALEIASPIDFRDGPSANAITLVLGDDESDAALRARNDDIADLVLGTNPPRGTRLVARLQCLAALEYVLVVRILDRCEPRVTGVSDGFRHYAAGWTTAEAFLHRLDDGRMLRSFRFRSGSYSPTVAFGVDIALSEDAEVALSILRSRLDSTAREHAAAALAEMTSNVRAPHRLIRTLGPDLIELAPD